MLYKFKLSIILVFLASLLFSCEYQLDKENFRDIEKPADRHKFDLNLVSEQDTIKIFSETEFTCNFNLYGLKFLSGEFILQGKTIGVYGEKGKFTINPQQFTPGYDTLTLVLYTSTGTGSLADNAGVEGYQAVRKWLVLIDGRPAPVITLTKSITPEGYLKLSWPGKKQYNLQSYTLYATVYINSFSKIITDADSNYYVDSCYIGGEANYRIDSRIVQSYEQGYGNQLYLNDPYPALQFSEKKIDSLRIFWNKSKYKASYKLLREDISQDSAIFKSHTDTSFTMLSPGLGKNVRFTLTTLPYKPNRSNSSYNKSDYKNYSLGTFFEGNWPVYAYNRVENVLYTSTYDDVHCYDINPFILRNTLAIKDLLYQKEYACPTNSTKVAVLSPYNIYIFPDKNLQDPVLIPYGSWGISIDHFFITDNDIIAIATQNKYEQIRISDKQVIASINTDNYPVYSKWSCITTSKNGKYACLVSQKGLNLYSIVNGAVTLLYTDTRSYRSALFDENSEGQLLLTFNDNNTLEVRNPSGFSLVNSVILPTKAEVLSNIDPETGYLLLTDYQYDYVMDLTSPNLKLRVVSTEFKPKLYSNRLFTGNGCTMDITIYLAK